MLPGAEALRDILPGSPFSWGVLLVSALLAVAVLVTQERADRRRSRD